MDQKESNFESNSQASKDLVKLLTELVSVAKGLISATPNKNDKIEQVQSTNDHLKYLYPSIRSGKQHSFNTTAHGTSRKRSSNTLKSLSSKKQKVHEMLRDVFFIDDPMVDEVPRRNERQRYYARGLVATAVKFNSNMSPEEARKVIIERFSNLPEMSDFEFVKAVDESLVSPSVDLWDFLTLKHVIGQGSIYLRCVSKNNDNIDFEQSC